VRIFALWLILRVTRSNTAHYVGVITYEQELEGVGVPGCSTRVMSGLKDGLYKSNLQYPSLKLRRASDLASDRAKALHARFRRSTLAFRRDDTCVRQLK